MEIRPALAPYVPLARMLAQTFGQDCEVVLHDLDCPEHSVVHVENPSVTGRKVGQSFDQLVRQVILSNELKEDFVANYYFTAPNGKRIRSSTLLIRGGDGRLTGALCLNLDTTRLTQQIAYLQSLGSRQMSVLQLKRLRIGGLWLDGSLAEGEYRRLTPEEIEKIRSDILSK